MSPSRFQKTATPSDQHPTSTMAESLTTPMLSSMQVWNPIQMQQPTKSLCIRGWKLAANKFKCDTTRTWHHIIIKIQLSRVALAVA